MYFLSLVVVTLAFSGQIECWVWDDGSSDDSSSKPPNVIFYIADDLGYNDLGYMNSKIKSPNIDSLKDGGVHITNQYVMNCCTPSRHCFMTGRYPYKTQMGHFVIIFNQPTCSPTNLKFMSNRFDDLGYETYQVGKWHLGFCQEACTPLQRGFDHTYGFLNGGETYYTHIFSGAGISGFDFRNGTAPDPSVNGSHNTYIIRDYLKEEFTDYSSKHGDTPFFIYLAAPNPHTPLDCPPEYYNQYPLVENGITLNRAKYWGLVTAMDDLIGNFTQQLQDEGLWDNTIFVFTSDNGGENGDFSSNLPYKGSKGSMYEGGYKAQAFITGPGIPVGETVDGLFHAIDWTPTLMDLVGGEQDPDFDGVSQVDMICNGGVSARADDVMILNIDLEDWTMMGMSAVRKGNYKLIWGSYGLTTDYGDQATLFYCLDENLSSIGKTVCDVPVCQSKGIHGSFSLDPTTKGIMTQINQAQAFDPNDITSGLVHFYDLSVDPYEYNNLASDASYASLILEYKQYILDALPDYMGPANTDTVAEANPANYNGFWSPGWGESYDLSLPS